MLARDHRLTSSRDFLGTIRRGRRAGTSTVVVHLTVGSAEPQPRVGLVVGKAVGDAVTRNRVKRRLRHVLRAQLGSLPRGAVLVVRALPAAAGASSSALDRDLRRALSRLGSGAAA